MENPSNGITVVIPAAANVIKDCATLAHAYIPHYVFGIMANPFNVLYKKITLEQVKDFVDRSNNDVTTLQLLRLILDKGRNIAIVPQHNSESEDPYGDYESAVKPQQQQHDAVYTLSILFGIL